MLSTEAVNEIIQDPTSDWNDEIFVEETDDIEELKTVGDESDQKGASRPTTTTKSADSPLNIEDKHDEIKPLRPSLYSFGSISLRRDPVIDSLIESRKFSIMENSYTRLAHVTSQEPRLTQRRNTLDLRPPTAEEGDEENARSSNSRNRKRIPIPKASELESQGWDDGLPIEQEKEPILPIEKSCSQLYHETCKRLNICPCSMILRSLNTTKINLRNYGLGPRGCAALAVAVLRNTTVTSLNLSGNDVGSEGMSHIYQILMENTYIDDYDLSFNNLSTNGISKLAAAILKCTQLQTLSVAGNRLTASDIQILLVKLEDHANLRDLNISHNQLEEEGGINLAEWLSDNNTLLNLDVSWCSIRLTGAKAMAKAVGDNNKLLSLDLSHNSFTNDTIDLITNSLTRNVMLCELNFCGNQFVSRFNAIVKENPAVLINGKDCQLYKMIVAAATNQSLKIFRLGHNHFDARCLMIILESLAKLDHISLEELDLTGLSMPPDQISAVELLFSTHPKLTCFVGPIRQTAERFANILLNLINQYCIENQATLSDMFKPSDEITGNVTVVTHAQFLDGLRRAKIPFPIALIEDIMKYIGRDNEEGLIILRSLVLD